MKPPLVTLSGAIRVLRFLKGISLQDLAHATDIEITRLWRMEVGKIRPSREELTRIVEAIGDKHEQG